MELETGTYMFMALDKRGEEGWEGWEGWGLGGWGSNQQFPQLEFTVEFRQFPLWGSDGAGTCMDNETSHLKSQKHQLPSFSQKVTPCDPRWPPGEPPGESMNFRSGCWSSRSTRAPRPPRRAARRPNAWWTRWSRCPTKTLPACNRGTLRNPKEIYGLWWRNPCIWHIWVRKTIIGDICLITNI